MNPINYLFFLIIIFIGIKTSISDFKNYKIKNKDISYGFFLGSLVYLTLILIQMFSNKNLITITYFIQLLINILFAIIIGIGFWLIKFWSAADAKLFILFAFLIPINLYETGIPLFFSFSIIINTFSILAIYTLYNIIKKRKNINFKKIRIKESLTPQILGSFIIIHWILKLTINFLPNDFFILFSSFIFLFSHPLLKILNKYKPVLFVLIGLRMVLDKSIYTLNFVSEFLGILLMFLLILILIKFIENIFSIKINIDKLKEGMILKYSIVKKKNKYYQLTKQNMQILFKPQKDKNKKTILEVFVPKETRGLNEEELSKIKKISKNNLIENKITIVEHTSFAIYLFIGTLITFLFKGSIIHIILKLL